MAAPIELIVSYHGTGRYTLMENDGSGLPKDLFHDADKGEFYRKVAIKMAELSAAGSTFTFSERGVPSN